MNTNLITGHIPSGIDQMVHLEYLSLYKNHLDGWLPEDMFSAQSLQIIGKFFSIRRNMLQFHHTGILIFWFK